MARDQNDYRLEEEETIEDMDTVFNEVIDNVVERMMDPCGNYLVQKLLEYCSDDQKLQIILKLTKEPSQLVKTSLNTHG